MKRVYFLGAGFSKAINRAYPTLAELTEIVLINLSKRHKGTAVANHLATVPNELHGNLELVLSYLFSDWPWKTTAEQDLDMSLYRNLTYEICAHLTEIETATVAEEFQILAHYLKSHDHGVITVNYDTLLERIAVMYWQAKRATLAHYYELVIEDRFDDIQRTSEQVPYLIEDIEPAPFKFQSKRIVVSRDFILQTKNDDVLNLVEDPRLDHKVGKTDRISLRSQLDGYLKLVRQQEGSRKAFSLKSEIQYRILKLHGSVDWVEEKNDTIRIPADQSAPSRKETLPLIVPPLLDKVRHYGSQKIRDVWFSAHSLLEEAEEVILIGFSFPATDLSVRFLFQSALKGNPLARIVVVNRDSVENLKISYEQVFFNEARTKLDYQYCDRDDALLAYVHREIMRNS